MVDYDRLLIYKHSIVSQFEMPAYLPSSTLSLSHSLDIQFTLDLIYSQDMTHEYSIRRAETSLHSKRHLVSCVIHVFLKDSPIQSPNSKLAQHSSSKTRFHTQLESCSMTSESNAQRHDTKMMKADSRQSQRTQASDALFGNMPTTSTEFYIDSHKQEPQFHRKSHKSLDPKSLLLAKSLHMMDDFPIPPEFRRSSSGLSHETRQKFADF